MSNSRKFTVGFSGFWKVKKNNHWWIIFHWREGQSENVKIIDYGFEEALKNKKTDFEKMKKWILMLPDIDGFQRVSPKQE